MKLRLLLLVLGLAGSLPAAGRLTVTVTHDYAGAHPAETISIP